MIVAAGIFQLPILIVNMFPDLMHLTEIKRGSLHITQFSRRQTTIIHTAKLIRIQIQFMMIDLLLPCGQIEIRMIGQIYDRILICGSTVVDLQ